MGKKNSVWNNNNLPRVYFIWVCIKKKKGLTNSNISFNFEFLAVSIDPTQFWTLSLSHIYAMNKDQTLAAWTKGTNEADWCIRFYSACVVKDILQTQPWSQVFLKPLLFREFTI